MKWHSWLIIGILTAMLLSVDVVTAWGWYALMNEDWQFLFAMVIGVCVAQVNLIAIWAALAPGRVMLRLPWSIFLATLMWYAIVLGCHTRHFWSNFFHGRYVGSDIDMGDAIVLGLVILAGVVAVQVPLWAMSRWFGWRLLPPMSDANRPDDERQFNLKHLIAGMVLASVSLGLGRVILPSEEWSNPQLDRELSVILPAVLVVNLIVVVPCVWIAFARLPRLVPLTLVWLVWAIIVSILEIALLSAILGPPPGEVWISFTLFNVAQGLSVLASLLVLRLVGFQLARRRRGEKSALATVTAKAPSDIMQPSQLPLTTTINSAEHP